MDAPAGFEQAVDAVEPGGRLVGVRALTGGVSADVFAFDIARPGGGARRVVVRRHRAVELKGHGPGVTVKEFHLLAALHRAGLAVPEPLVHVDSGAPTSAYLVMEWIDGSPELLPADVAGGLDQMAGFLVDLHALDPSTLHVPGLDPIEDPLAAIAPYLPPTDRGRAVAALVAAASAVEVHPARCVVLHGDYWPGNVLWRDGRLASVIDWEDAVLGDPLADLATARVELLCQYGERAMERFTARYHALHEARIGPLRLDALPRWEVYVSAAALATMGGWGLEPGEEARRRAHTERFFDAAARRLG
jgi:aminoglycoside phosphotransferase (APT) family kinase protein